jgi:peptidyl-Lys metalloendopeptidase
VRTVGVKALQAPTFNRCTTTQQSQLVTALDSARSYATNSQSYMNAGVAGPRYVTWFGTYTASRFGTVDGHYENIAYTLHNERVDFDCSCKKKTTYAYVYPTQPYRIYLCGAFWSAPNTGTDSRAGTIIHETSHFDVVANTDDVVYGTSGAKNLAATNPNDAIRNADNHEYFSENTPFQN